MAVRNNHPAVDSDPARRRWKQILIAVCAEPSFEFRGDRYQIFHRQLPRKLDVPIRQRKLPLPRARLGERKQIGDPLRRDRLLHLFFLRSSAGHRCNQSILCYKTFLQGKKKKKIKKRMINENDFTSFSGREDQFVC
jgi:hypothetical protein